MIHKLAKIKSCNAFVMTSLVGIMLFEFVLKIYVVFFSNGIILKLVIYIDILYTILEAQEASRSTLFSGGNLMCTLHCAIDLTLLVTRGCLCSTFIIQLIQGTLNKIRFNKGMTA